MQVIIVGSGRWANLIGRTLRSLGVKVDIVGQSDSSTISRAHDIDFKDVNFVVIASATVDHLADLIWVRSNFDGPVFVEKGFDRRIVEKGISKFIEAPYDNVYILSQYRFSGVMESLRSCALRADSASIHFDVQYDLSELLEWVPHIESIYNFILSKNAFLPIWVDGGYEAITGDRFSVVAGAERKFEATLIFDNQSFMKVNFGKTNEIVDSYGCEVELCSFPDEDCVLIQTNEILCGNLEKFFTFKDYLKSEKLTLTRR